MSRGNPRPKQPGKSVVWTEPERDILRQWYPIERPKDVVDRLPGRTIEAVKHEARKLGVRSGSAPRAKEQQPISGLPATWNAAESLAYCGRWV